MVQGTRRKNPNSILSITGVRLEFGYCRFCLSTKAITDFAVATDLYLDKNGFFSVCAQCQSKIYNESLEKEGTIESALLLTCRLLNVAYSESAVKAFKKQAVAMENAGKMGEIAFGTYLTLMKRYLGTKVSLTYSEPKIEKEVEIVAEVATVETEVQEEEPEEISEIIDNSDTPIDIKQFWGNSYSNEDYVYLQNEFKDWQDVYGGKLKADIELYKSLSHKALDIRKARDKKDSTVDLEKEYREIMKVAEVSPEKQQAKQDPKNLEALGIWIQQIETKRPAEWFNDQTKFHDMDGMEDDIKDIKRSMSNFVTGSRDFNTTDLDELNDLELSDDAGDSNDS